MQYCFKFDKYSCFWAKSAVFIFATFACQSTAVVMISLIVKRQCWNEKGVLLLKLVGFCDKKHKSREPRIYGCL